MRLRKLTSNMMVDDVNRTLGFYCDTLGLNFVMGVTKDKDTLTGGWRTAPPLDFALVQNEAISMMFQSRERLMEKIPHFREKRVAASTTFYFEVEDIDELYSRLRGKVIMVSDMHETGYGMREFNVQDPNGYILTFAEKYGKNPLKQ